MNKRSGREELNTLLDFASAFNYSYNYPNGKIVLCYHKQGNFLDQLTGCRLSGINIAPLKSSSWETLSFGLI
jgi:hypothetical protein